MTRLLRLWFGFTAPVDRRAYLLSGLGLGVLKYVVDATLVRAFTGQGWTLIDYLSPSLLLPAGKALVQPVPLVWLMLGWTIPFLWIGASMSIRRALDADLSPGLAFLFFVPFVNWLLMLGLAAAPSRPASAPRSPALAESPLEARIVVLCTLLDVALTYAVLGIGVYLLRDYGVALFVGLPFLLGAMNGYVCNRIAPRSVSATVMATGISLVLLSATLLLFAAEGIFCVLMAFPLIAPVVMAASILGRFLALRCRTRPASAAFGLLLWPALQAHDLVPRGAPPLREVASSIEVAAPPEAVWRHVIGFAEIPEPPEEWFFRAGIAWPRRARIEGRGVGAVRHCEFSTGAFVEPITAWDEPRRLAFDVIAQPPPLVELSPWGAIHPPHLDGWFRSRRGEFRLVPLPGGRTRLEGSTWYELGLRPGSYWSLWADALVHRIHARVLAHVRRLAEG